MADKPRRVVTFRLEDELLAGLRALYQRDGVQVSESVRRAIAAWLEAKGLPVRQQRAGRKADRQRAATRKRP